jgi:transposase
MKPPPPKIIEMNPGQVAELLEHAQAALNEADYTRFKALIESYVYLTRLLEQKGTTIDRLRKLLFGSQTEKTAQVLPSAGSPSASGAGSQPGTSPATAGQDGIPGAGSPNTTATTGEGAATGQDAGGEAVAGQAKGHGRNGADDYHGADRIHVPHASLNSGDSCPECKKGQVYEVARPGMLIRITGQAPVQATVYELQKLRCNLCGKVFTAEPPAGIGTEKYDAASASMIALLKYGSGVPFNRLEGLQGSLGIPLPASTQWEIVEGAAEKVEPAYQELIRQAAQGEVLQNDDTTMKILEWMGQRAAKRALAEEEVQPEVKEGVWEGEDASVEREDEDAREDAAQGPGPEKGQPPRTGIFTSGIVSTHQGRTISLFFTGHRHAGENLAEVLKHRAAELGPPIQMCDALTRNVPSAFKTILANCLAHGRRQFVEVVEQFPDPCRHVLETLGEVYKNDEAARQRNLSPQERLAFHRTYSGKRMGLFKGWLYRQLDQRLVEPNSGLGKAIRYMLKHWMKLVLFLRKPGAPLDNNITERALKLAILHRKNAMFYLSEHGAHVGDIFMSLIHTCRLNTVNPFDYLTELQNHATTLAAAPQNWMPWNYRETIATAASSLSV